MIQILISILIFLILIIPLGRYSYKVVDNHKTFADAIFDPIDNFIYKISKIHREPMNWKKYSISLLTTNIVIMLMGYIIIRTQSNIFLNPNNIPNMDGTLSLNTVISFMTNTNLQHYSGESGLSYFSQLAVITVMMFTSAATGWSASMAFIRGICGRKTLGNFYEDMVRVITRILIPLSLIIALALVWQGTIQNFEPTKTIQTIEGLYQDLPMGPSASIVAIKHLGTNGGGFVGANSSTPIENPSIATGMIQLISMMLLPGVCVIIFGLMYHGRNKELELNKEDKIPFLGKEARTILIGMLIMFLLGVVAIYWAESSGNKILENMGLNQNLGSMEGKEVRFGIAHSSLFTVTTTSFTTGTVNNMHDTLTPLGGLIPLLHMMLNMVFGGIGVGFMNMITYVFLAVFICGLMVGRTPEYLKKKIENREITLVVICILLHPLLILGFSALAVSTSSGLEGITNPGFHGLSQIVYEFTSSAANNGSSFQGLKTNTTFWNITTGAVMFIGRYVPIILQLAVAGSLSGKNDMNTSKGSLRTDTISFGIILAAICYILAALTFLPALALGPIAEYLTLLR